MPYKIDVYEDLHLLVSTITAYEPTPTEVDTYLDHVAALGEKFIELGFESMYHIIVFDQREFGFAKGMRRVRAIQQHRGIIAMRKRLNTMSIFVGRTPKPLQILITLLSHPTFGGRKMLIFPTLEEAMSFVRFDMAYEVPASAEPTDIS